ncbi:MAG TPA: hypothetical protein VIM11_04145 [Tepidisphaeraceae bacterium]|jgi:hypothetical protein
MTLRRIGLDIIILVLAGFSLAADQGSFDGGIDPSIWRVVSGGAWKTRSGYGSFRVVVRKIGMENTRSYLFVQWLKTDEQKQKVTEFKTAPVSEFNEGDWPNVRDVRYENGVFLVSYVLRSQEERIRTAELRPSEPGKYEFVFK